MEITQTFKQEKPAEYTIILQPDFEKEIEFANDGSFMEILNHQEIENIEEIGNGFIFDSDNNMIVERLEEVVVETIEDDEETPIEEMATDNTSKTWYICKICNSKFNTKYFYQKHLLKHPENVFICKMCGKAYEKESRLKVHCKSVHGVELALKCDFCPRTFKSAKVMKNHCTAFHATSSKVPESVVSNSKQEKEVYVKICTEKLPKEKPEKQMYVCPKCDATFVRIETLTNHMLKHRKVIISLQPE